MDLAYSQEISGLTTQQVLALRQSYGYNKLPEAKSFKEFEIFIEQFKSPLIILLIVTIILSLIFLEYFDALLIASVSIINILIGFFQELQAHRTLKSLTKVIEPEALVIRNNQRLKLAISELVPQDIVVLGSGDKVPADGILLESNNLLINEAILTGEHEALAKSVNQKAFMGTLVLSGLGILKVTKTGVNTEIGKVGKTLIEIEPGDTPIQKSLAHFSNVLIRIVFAICLLIFFTGLFRGQEINELIKVSIILSIAAIPEGLPIVVTIILSLGMNRILKQKGLVKNLSSAETLGSTSVICIDKTGTITTGKMAVVKTEITDLSEAIKAIVVNSERRTNFELALYDFAVKSDQKLVLETSSKKKSYVETFSSGTKYALTALENGKTYLIGAPDIILSKCMLNADKQKRLIKTIDEWAEEGLRMVGIALSQNNQKFQDGTFTWIGLIGIKDPIRPEAKDMIARTMNAGIKIKLVTGDYLNTAKKIARDLGLSIEAGQAIHGQEIDKMSDEELKRSVSNITVFARVTPHHKLRIVEALQSRGEVVAMSGDGVNDVLALKKADIGIVMGDATEISKEVGDLILVDNNFSTVVKSCEEGRLIYNNLTKVVYFMLSNSFAEILLIFISMLLGMPAPLSVAQILLIHLICDGPSDIVLGFDNLREGLMDRKPKDFMFKAFITKKHVIFIFLISICIALFGFILYSMHLQDLMLARTIVYIFIGLSSFAYLVSFRDLRHSILKTKNILGNRYIFLTYVYGFAIIVGSIYIPQIATLLEVKPIELGQLLEIICFIIPMFVIIDLLKRLTFSGRSN